MDRLVDIFVASNDAIAANIPMTPRSANDKEYFPQDWFIDRLQSLGLQPNTGYEQGGRNSYPDFWVKAGAGLQDLGFEIKSLSFSSGRPARADYDSNSTVPSGKKDGKDVFVAFFLYTGSGASPRPVHSLVIAHTDLINADHAIAGGHFNASIKKFGSYADGFIRNRKMYVFPHPYTLVPSCVGKCSLITPSSWALADARITKAEVVDRQIAPAQLRGYTIDLQNQAHPTVTTEPYPNAGQVNSFDVWRIV